MRLEGLLGYLRPFDTFLALLGVIFYVHIDSSPIHMSRYALEFPVPPADLVALSPGYRVPLDLATIPYAPLAYAVCTPGGRNVRLNVRNDVAGSVT